MIKFIKEPIKKQMRKTGMVRELEIGNQKLRNQIKNLNSQVNNVKTENCNLKKIVKSFEVEKIELKNGMSSFIESKYNPLKKGNDVLKEELEDTKKVNQVLEEELGDTKKVNQVLEEELGDTKKVNQVLEAELGDTKKVNQKFFSERSELVAHINYQISNLKKINQGLEDRLKKTQAENQNLKNRISSLKFEKQKLLYERSELVGYSLKTDIRGTSTDAGKPAVIKYILENVDKWNSKILDVGFGSGVYGKLLRAFLYQHIDGLDVYEDNIKEMGLDKIYDNIYIKNILDFDFEYYDLIIMGDVLEHIELESSKKLLSEFIKNNKCGNIIVSIPFEYKQGEAYGNPYEKHLQPNVNKEYMEEHFPYLQLVDTSKIPLRGGIIATYVWNKYMFYVD